MGPPKIVKCAARMDVLNSASSEVLTSGGLIMGQQFTISDSGYVYRRILRKTNGKHRAKSLHFQLLGHISTLLGESAPPGDEIRRWWRKQYLPKIEAELRC